MDIDGRGEVGQAALGGFELCYDDGYGAFADEIETRVDAGEAVGGIVAETQSGAGDVVGDAEAFVAKEILDTAPVAEDDVDAMTSDPAGEHSAEHGTAEIVGKKQRRDAAVDGNGNLFHQIAGGVAVAAGIFVGAADGETDALVAEGGGVAKSEADLAQLVVADDSGVGLGVAGVDLGDGELFPVERDLGEAGREGAEHDALDPMFAKVVGEAARIVIVFADGERIELVAKQVGLATSAVEHGLEVRWPCHAGAGPEVFEEGDARGGGANGALLTEAAECVINGILFIADTRGNFADTLAGGFGDARMIAEGERDGGDVIAGFPGDVLERGPARDAGRIEVFRTDGHGTVTETGRPGRIAQAADRRCRGKGSRYSNVCVS